MVLMLTKAFTYTRYLIGVGPIKSQLGLTLTHLYTYPKPYANDM